MSEIYIRVCAGNEKSLKIDCSQKKKKKEKLLKIKCIVLQFCKYVKIFLQLCFLCTRKHMKEPTYTWFHCFKVVEKWHCYYFFCLFIIRQSRLLLWNERPYTNFCFEIKGHRQASKLCAFDCSMFSYLLMFVFFQSPLSPPSWCVPRVMRSSLLPGISVSMLSRNTASAYTKR